MSNSVSCKNSNCNNQFPYAKYGGNIKKFCSTKCRQEHHSYSLSYTTTPTTATTTTNNDDLSQKIGLSLVKRGAAPVMALGAGLGPVGVFGLGVAADVARPILSEGIKRGSIRPLGSAVGGLGGYFFTKGQPLWVRLLAAFGGASFGNIVEKTLRNMPIQSSYTTTPTTATTRTRTRSRPISEGNLSVEDIMSSNYNSFDMSADYFGLIFGYKPADPFHTASYGKAGSGKTTLAVKFADYFAKKFGKVKILSSEMGTGDGLKSLLTRAKVTSKKISIDARPKMKSVAQHIEELKSGNYKLLVIDSINHLRWDADDLELIKREVPELSTYIILQSVKEGNFKGSNEYAHNADIVLKIDDMDVFTEKTRFNKKKLASVPVNM